MYRARNIFDRRDRDWKKGRCIIFIYVAYVTIIWQRGIGLLSKSKGIIEGNVYRSGD